MYITLDTSKHRKKSNITYFFNDFTLKYYKKENFLNSYNLTVCYYSGLNKFFHNYIYLR